MQFVAQANQLTKKTGNTHFVYKFHPVATSGKNKGLPQKQVWYTVSDRQLPEKEYELIYTTGVKIKKSAKLDDVDKMFC